jgi:hypothetical protein
MSIHSRCGPERICYCEIKTLTSPQCPGFRTGLFPQCLTRRYLPARKTCALSRQRARAKCLSKCIGGAGQAYCELGHAAGHQCCDDLQTVRQHQAVAGLLRQLQGLGAESPGLRNLAVERCVPRKGEQGPAESLSIARLSLERNAFSEPATNRFSLRRGRCCQRGEVQRSSYPHRAPTLRKSGRYSFTNATARSGSSG